MESYAILTNLTNSSPQPVSGSYTNLKEAQISPFLTYYQ